MGQSELEAALRKGGEDKARAIWATVEAEAERLRTETAETLKREQQTEQARRETQIQVLQAEKRTAAEQQAQFCRLQAEKALAERLLSLAEKLLEDLAIAGGGELFQALAAEIPKHHWQQVRVNRRDQEKAAACFPSVEVELADDISAGLVVQDQEARVQIINTLEKRLIHLWPELLPELMAELRPMAAANEPVI